ncbi:MAG: cupredoxin domain-containing protein [Rubricoccaceae bacterium]|nr:cupredoxin domain-containing protein [Rubricoccaceae bacterium]
MRLVSYLFIVVLCGLFTACTNSDASQQDHAASAIETSTAEPAINRVDIALKEYAYEISRDTFIVGTPYTFYLRNDGVVAHEWAVVPRGAVDEEGLLIEVEEDELAPGAAYTAEFTFPEAGEYDFVCFMEEPVSHDASGMRLPVTVIN